MNTLRQLVEDMAEAAEFPQPEMVERFQRELSAELPKWERVIGAARVLLDEVSDGACLCGRGESCPVCLRSLTQRAKEQGLRAALKEVK